MNSNYPKIDLIRFSVKGAHSQLFNYIPVISGAKTKVNINFVLHLNSKARAKMKHDEVHRIVLIIDPSDTDNKQQYTNDLPLDNLTDEDFIDLSVGFMYQTEASFSQLNLSLAYINSTDNQLNDNNVFFSTSIPVKKENSNG